MATFIRMQEIINRLSKVNDILIEDICDEINISRRTLLRYLKNIREYDPYLTPHINGDKVVLKKRVENLSPSYESNMDTILDTTPWSLIHGETDETNRGRVLKKKQLILRNLLRAQKDHIYTDIEYDNGKEVVKHRIAPLKFYIDNHLIYLGVLEVTKYNGPILLAFDKIISVKLGVAGPDKKEAAEILDFIESGWGKMFYRDKTPPKDVTFRVEPNILAYFINNPIHKSQEFRPDNKAGVIKLKVHNLSEFARFTIRFGKSLKIQQPPELVDEMKEFLTEMRKFYDKEV